MVDIRFVTETGSTNDDVRALALQGAREGLWLRAGRQSLGRGRMGRDWQGASGNLFASGLVRLQPHDPAPASLALVAAVAVHRALSDFVSADAIMIKWPNDIMAGPAKLCGMLLERAGDAVIIGIGVNIDHAPSLPDRQTTCLRNLGAAGCDAASVLEAIADHFMAVLNQWRVYGIATVIHAWKKAAHPTGTPLIAVLPNGDRVAGNYETLDEEGALILRLANGNSHAIHAGDVFLI